MAEVGGAMDAHRMTDTLEQRLGLMFKWAGEHFWLMVVLLFLLAVVVRLAIVPYNIVSSNDAYSYIVKSLEMTRGDFSPMKNHQGIIWNVLLAPFLLVLGQSSSIRYMNIARTLSALIGAAAVVPTALIAKEVLSKRDVPLALVLVTFSPLLVLSSSSGNPEPLFTVLFLFSMWFVCKALANPWHLLMAGAVGGLTYGARTNGLFVLPIILISYFLLRNSASRFSYKYLLYSALLFLVVISPLLYQRQIHFGSPFYYGDAGKYWVGDVSYVYTNLPAPPFTKYLKTHTLAELFDRFIVSGFFKALAYFGYFLLSPLIVLFFMYGIIRYGWSRQFIPFTIAIIIFILGLTPLFKFWASPKYFEPLIPLVLLLSSAALSEIFRKHQYRHLLLALFLLIFSLYSSAVPVAIRLGSIYAFDTPVGMWYRISHGGDHGGAEWGKWVAENIQGRVVLVRGDQLIMMHLPDTRQGADDAARYGIEHGGSDYYAPESNLSLVSHGVFDTFDDAMEWYRALEVTHIVVDESLYKLKKFYLRDIWEGRDVPPYLEEVYSTYGTGAEWEVRIYTINWTGYPEGKGEHNP